MDRNHTCLAKNGHKELWRYEKRTPDENWITLFEGIKYIPLPDGSAKEAPERLLFGTEGEGQAWLSL